MLGREIAFLTVQRYGFGVFFVNNMRQQFRRTEASRNHRSGIFGAADIAFFNVFFVLGVVLRIFSALGAFVALDDMTADIILARCINQFVTIQSPSCFSGI